MSDINQTQFFKVNVEPELRVKEVLDTVYNAMREKATIRSIRSWVTLCLATRLTSPATTAPAA